MAEELATSEQILAQARERYAHNAWQDAYELLTGVDRFAPLSEPDLWLLAWCCGLAGHDDEMLLTLERIYQAHAEGGDPLRAARAAFWLGFRKLGMGDASQASGWLVRAERMIERAGCDCVESGYLLLPRARRHFRAGDYAAALQAATEAERIGERFGDGDLQTFGRHLQGRVLLRQGEVESGLKLLDEAMLSVTTGELSPSIRGLIYCSAIDSCQTVFALDRARQWTQALGRWCDAQPQLITFTGACMVSRAEILLLGGEWPAALAEAERAVERFLITYGARATGEARYRQAEVLRLRGELSAAEAIYREVSEGGRDPYPGLALLRLAQGRADLALPGIRRALGDAKEPFQRAQLLPAWIEILLANAAIDEARAASTELESIASRFESELLGALGAHARGSVELAEGNAQAAAASFRNAFRSLRELGAPYFAARARIGLACACQVLGDEDGALLEAQAARAAFLALGAVLDVAAVDALARQASGATSNSAGLSVRELEVLRLVAAGKTNKLIARELCLSEKTIDRHLSNILAKLDVPSRAGATAYAYEHKLL